MKFTQLVITLSKEAKQLVRTVSRSLPVEVFLCLREGKSSSSLKELLSLSACWAVQLALLVGIDFLYCSFGELFARGCRHYTIHVTFFLLFSQLSLSCLPPLS